MNWNDLKLKFRKKISKKYHNFKLKLLKIASKSKIYYRSTLEYLKIAVLKLMKSVNQNYKILSLWFLLSSATIIFSNKIAIFLAKYNYLGREETSTVSFKIIFSFLVFIVLVKFIWYFLINYRLSKSFIFWTFGIGVVYILKIRYNTDNLSLINFYKPFYYSDIIIFVTSLTIILLVRNLLKDFTFVDKLKRRISKKMLETTSDTSMSFIEDIPVNGLQKNDLDELANQLIETLINFKPQQAFIIGIRAKWGYGKTTFLKRFEYKICFESNYEIAPIVFWFNTWKNTDERGVVNNFFELLKKELSFFSGNVESAVNKYVSKLLSVIYAKEVRVLKTFTDDLIGEKVTLSDYYNRIEDILKDLNRQIIVIVDDLDRLNKLEILETLKILRNVANFKNVIFICGLDKEYLIKNAELENNYLDKIFNLEIDLPVPNENKLILLLKDLIVESSHLNNLNQITDLERSFSLNQNIKDRIIKEIDNIFYVDSNNLEIADLNLEKLLRGVKKIETADEAKSSTIIEITLFPSLFFNSVRDIKRFYNYLVTNLKILKKIDDLILNDYILFHLLLFKYDWMRRNFEQGQLNLWTSGNTSYTFTEQNIEKLYKPAISHTDARVIFTILKRLFPSEEIIEGKGINQKRYSPIYINNNIYNESFSYLDILKSHKEGKIRELTDTITDKLILNDIKSFILKQENLMETIHFTNAIELIKYKMETSISDAELLNFIDYGERLPKEEFINIAEQMFLDIDDVFGKFLGSLNFFYSITPKDFSVSKISSSSFEDFFKSRRKANPENGHEFKYLNSEFVKNKTIALCEKFIENTDSMLNVNRVVNFGYDKYFEYFDFGYLYSEIQIAVQKYIEKYFKEIFFQIEPQNIIGSIDLDYFANLYVDDNEKLKLYEQATKIIKKQNFSTNALDKKDFLKNGLANFIKIFNEFSQKDDLNAEEKYKHNKLLDHFEDRLGILSRFG